MTETLAGQARIPVMAVFEHWTEVLRCLNCGLAGVANLSQPITLGGAILIDSISEGFKAVSSQYGDTSLVKAATGQQRRLRDAGGSQSREPYDIGTNEIGRVIALTDIRRPASTQAVHGAIRVDH